MANSSLYDKITLPAANRSEDITSQMYKGFSTISPDAENFSLYDLSLIKQDLLNHYRVDRVQPLFSNICYCRTPCAHLHQLYI